IVTAGPLAEPLSTASAAGAVPVASAPTAPPTTSPPPPTPPPAAPPAAPASPPAAPATTTPPAPPPAPKPVAPPTTLAAVRAAGVVAAAPSGSVVRPGAIGPYQGLGTWIDVYDWSITYTKNQPTVGPQDVAAMANAGVQTLYVQMARGDTPDDVWEADRMRAIVDQAHAHGIAVVGWYLPYLTNPADDMRHLVAIARFGVEGVGVDIEAKNVA